MYKRRVSNLIKDIKVILSKANNSVMKTYIVGYQESNTQLFGLCVEPLTIVITYMICDSNNYIFSDYKIFGIF